VKTPRHWTNWFTQPPAGPERRRTSRFRAKAAECDLGTIADLSASGVRIRCRRHHKPTIGSRVNLSVTGEDGRRVTIPCSVCWVRPVGEYHEAGLEFNSPDVHDLQRLAEIVNNAGSQSPPDEQTRRAG